MLISPIQSWLLQYFLYMTLFYEYNNSTFIDSARSLKDSLKKYSLTYIEFDILQASRPLYFVAMNLMIEIFQTLYFKPKYIVCMQSKQSQYQ